ncbi:hypothetical protein DBR47_17685 [Paucibacter sp. KBW04]|uniref:DUF6622 family protein n=1 Tax=Paucibacter sp. KBW04 TaxID=2153361 RepID=UPI000F561F4D|nr:DUF6622 family protein [Paucibacter sp. KBW04]RQO56357.1 hypothetical protein DBR47_17685 [Paucibacter sp. KBW04]
MQSSNSPLLAILGHVPLWVWAILALLLALGLKQSRDQHLPRARLALLPMIWLAYGVWGVHSAFGASAHTLLAWALALIVSLKLMRELGAPAGSRFDSASQQFFVPGSWLPLAVMLSLFCAKFALGLSLALRPELAANSVVAMGFSALFGALSGCLLGRARNILGLQRLSSGQATLTPAPL